MGRPKKTTKVVEEPIITPPTPQPIEPQKKRKYTKKETKKKDEDKIIEEIEKINMDDFKMEEEIKEEKEIENERERLERKEVKWEEIDYKPMIVKKEKIEEKIFSKDEWINEYQDREIHIYIYHSDISKCKMVSEESMNEKKFLYQIFIYGREGNDCIINGEKREDMKIQKIYKYENINIHLLEDLPPLLELGKEKWRQYILFYKMDNKEMTDDMRLQRVMRKDLWFYEKYGNLIRMTIDNTYVLEREIYIRCGDKKYSMNFQIKNLIEKIIE